MTRRATSWNLPAASAVARSVPIGQVDLLVGSTVGERFTLRKLIGKGGFGAVFQADDENGPRCAVKLIRCERFIDRSDALREASLLQDHAHPSLIGFRDAGRVGPGGGSYIYIAMELGQSSLYDRIHRDRDRLSGTEAASLIHDVLDGLEHLHGRGVAHRDIKPGNLIRIGKHYKLCDFGAARALDASGEPAVALREGTAEYMAPEAFEGKAGAPADIWSLGLVLHECLTGELPFPTHGEPPETIAKLVSALSPVIDPSIEEPFATIIRGCLARDPSERITLSQIRALLDKGPRALPRRGVRAGFGALALLAGAVVAVVVAIAASAHAAF